MADVSAIEWTDATWNPTTGCSKVSPGCANCYAETLSLRYGWSKKPWTPEHAADNVVLHPERLEKPLTWKKPRMVFVNSMSDLFHEQIPVEFVNDVFGVIAASYALGKGHTFQILTKRPERMQAYFANSMTRTHIANRAAHYCEDGDNAHDGVLFDWWPLPNVWLGTSIENDRHAFRADVLREIPAAVRFISAEPLLGPLNTLSLRGIDWLIVGGESGHGHRPMEPRWVEGLHYQAIGSGAAFFFKQWGGRTPKAGGRLLDGREWSEMPTKVAPRTPADSGGLPDPGSRSRSGS